MMSPKISIREFWLVQDRPRSEGRNFPILLSSLKGNTGIVLQYGSVVNPVRDCQHDDEHRIS